MADHPETTKDEVGVLLTDHTDVELAREVLRLRTQNGLLRAMIRVNALRWQPELSHEEIDRRIEEVSCGG